MNKKKLIYIILLIIVIVGVAAVVIATSGKTAQTNADTNNIAVNSLMGGTSIGQNDKPTKEQIQKNSEEPLLEITDRIFINQTTDLYVDRVSYEGRKIKLEGFLMITEWEDESIYNVLRKTPGCCGDDGYAGIELDYDQDYPEDNAWLEVEGSVEYYEDGPNVFPILKVSKLTVKQTRGAEFLEQ